MYFTFLRNLTAEINKIRIMAYYKANYEFPPKNRIKSYFLRKAVLVAYT